MKLYFGVLLTVVLNTYSAAAFLDPVSSTRLLRRSWHHDIEGVSSPGARSAISSIATERQPSPLSMGLGDAFSKAFANEDMGSNKMQNPGLKSDLKWCMVTVNGRTVKAVQGQRLRDAVKAAGAKIEYGCEKGNCGTCESIVDGKVMRVCKAIVPRNKDKLTVKTKFG